MHAPQQLHTLQQHTLHNNVKYHPSIKRLGNTKTYHTLTLAATKQLTAIWRKSKHGKRRATLMHANTQAPVPPAKKGGLKFKLFCEH